MEKPVIKEKMAKEDQRVTKVKLVQKEKMEIKVRINCFRIFQLLINNLRFFW